MGNRHLSNDRLIALCFQEGPLATEREHLATCTACSDRRGQLASSLAEVSDVATADADAVFDSDRLARQRARILLRLEQEGKAGRVIAFPAAPPERPSMRPRPAMRWIAAAATAGLLIGVVADHLAHVLPMGRSGAPVQVAYTQQPAMMQVVSTTLSEEELLGLLEVALENTGGSSLQPLDDLTPRVWEVAAK